MSKMKDAFTKQWEKDLNRRTTLPVSTKKKADNRMEYINLRQRSVFSVIWQLNEQEVSYLDKHFKLIRSVKDLKEKHTDDYTLGALLLNAGIHYTVVFNSMNGWSALAEDDVVKCSFRYQHHSRLAVVIVKPAMADDEGEGA